MVGRGSSCDIVLRAPIAGHRHCWIVWDDAESAPSVVPGGHSERSPRIGGVVLTRPQRLAEGDRIEIVTEADGVVVAELAVERGECGSTPP
jgi:hypothetical protein